MPTVHSPDRTAVVTGARRGFGRAIAEAALDAGDVVVAAVRRPDALEDLADARQDIYTLEDGEPVGAG